WGGRSEHAGLYGGLRDWINVKEAAEELLEAQAEKRPQELALAHNANGLALVNLASQDERYPKMGLAELKKAVELAPLEVDYAMAIAEQHLQRGDSQAGETILLEWIDSDAAKGTDVSKACLVYARHLATNGRLDEARRYHEKSLRRAGDDDGAVLEAKLAYAGFVLNQWIRAVREAGDPASFSELFEEAVQILQEAIAADPDGFGAPLQLAVLYRLADRHNDVIEVCEARLRRGFSRTGLESARNRVRVFQLNIHASKACVALAGAAQDPGARDEQLERAEQYLADARGESPNHPLAFSQEGWIHLTRGHERAALESFRVADERFRAYGHIDWENKRVLARLHLKLKEPGAAKAVLEEVRNEAPQRTGSLDFLLLWALVLLETGEPDDALSICERILLADPGNTEATQLKAAIFERKGEPRRAGLLVESEAIRATLEAKQLSLDGNPDGAIAVLRDALENTPDDDRLITELIRLLLGRNRAEEAQAVVERAIEANPQSTRFQSLGVWLRPDLSLEERDRGILSIIDQEEDEYRRALDRFAFHVRKQNLPEALEAIEEALELLTSKATPLAQSATNAHDRVLLREKLRIGGLLDDDKAVQEALDAAIQRNVDGAGGQTLLGLHHMYRKEWDLAVAAFKKAIQVQTTDTRTLAYLGQCLLMSQKADEARIHLERAVAINPNEGVAHRGLGRLAQLRGDQEAFEQHLDICERLLPNDAWVRASILARRDRADPAAAITRREAALKDSPDDSDNLRQLAFLCETAGNLAKADEYYRRLLELHPDDKDVVVTTSRYYGRTDRTDKSLALVTRYADSRTTTQERANGLIVVAAHYLAADELDLVETTLLEAADMAATLEVLESLGEFYLQSVDRPAEALRWYERVIAMAQQEQLPRLSRLLAARIRCVLHRKLDDVGRARSLVDELLARFPEELNGLLLDSETHERAGNIDEALSALSRYLERAPQNPQALYRRAQHYVAQGRVPEAVEDLETIKRRFPQAIDLQPRFLLARLHQQSGRGDLWIAELEGLVKDSPDSVMATTKLVQAFIAQGRLGEADRMVTAQINRTTDHPDARWYALRGMVSQQLKDFDKALSDYDRSAQLSDLAPLAVARVLDLYATIERHADGVAYYEEHAEKLKKIAGVVSRYALLLARVDRKDQAVDAFREAMGLAARETTTAANTVTRHIVQAFPVEEAVALFESGEDRSTRANQRILARLYRAAKRSEEAAGIVERLIQTAQTQAERGQLLEEQGDLYNLGGEAQLAREAYIEVLRLDDNNWVVLNNLAYLLADALGEYALARPYAERAAAISESSSTLDTLGWIYVGLRDYRRAVAELNRAIRLNADSAESYYHLGEAYRRDRQFDQAAEILRRGKEVAQATRNESVADQIEAALKKVSIRDGAP
ncbi:MAG: tetratricopeptide repeat protein, partial [Planctomycetes bacterium]|nr:tetratricopeptide repeat protein [Planctomycetota bacterium]